MQLIYLIEGIKLLNLILSKCFRPFDLSFFKERFWIAE